MFDYITGITIGSLTANMVVNLDIRAWNNWLGLSLFILFTIIMQYTTLKFRYLNKVIVGEPTVVINNGEILENNMRRMRFTVSDLTERLRQKNIFNISDVEFAILESSGKLSIQKKSQYQPLTPKDMGIPTEYKGVCTEVIQEGEILEVNLKQINLNKTWLLKELKEKHNIANIRDVFYAEVDTSGILYIDLYKEKSKSFTNPSDYKGPY
nr:DUF421 domain-containing protein [Desulforamulus aquiferis]